jgi:hypothetical protein
MLRATRGPHAAAASTTLHIAWRCAAGDAQESEVLVRALHERIGKLEIDHQFQVALAPLDDAAAAATAAAVKLAFHLPARDFSIFSSGRRPLPRRCPCGRFCARVYDVWSALRCAAGSPCGLKSRLPMRDRCHLT